MLNTRVIPCLLKRDESLVKTIHFDKFHYIGDPINTIKIFNNLEVDELVFLDITATKNRKIDFEMIKEIASECFMPLAYGGGIKTVAEIKKIFSLGIEKVVICTAAVEKPTLIKEASDIFGAQSIVVSIDVKKNRGRYEVFTHSGEKPTGLDPLQHAKEVVRLGAGEIFLNSIDRDGLMEGYDLFLIKKISQAVDIPVVACGGAGEISDLGKAVKSGASAVAAGSIFVYQKRNRAVLVNFPSEKELKDVLPKGSR